VGGLCGGGGGGGEDDSSGPFTARVLVHRDEDMTFGPVPTPPDVQSVSVSFLFKDMPVKVVVKMVLERDKGVTLQ